MQILDRVNVHYEKNSAYSFDQLNESEFIQNLFDHLVVKMGSSFDEYEFFIFSNHNPAEIPESIHRKSDKKKVLFYFSEEKGNDPGNIAPHYFAVFKSYILKNEEIKNIFPLSLGYVKDVPVFPIKPISERKYNIFFRGNLNNNRIDFYRNLSWIKYFLPKKIVLFDVFKKVLLGIKSDFSNFFPDSIIFFNKEFKTGFSSEEYGRILSESKIVLCPKGFSTTECFRHNEAMRAGCVVVSEKLPPTEFYLNSPIIQIKNWNEGLKIVQDLINDQDKMEKIQKEMINWWQHKCSEKATAEYINRKLHTLNASTKPAVNRFVYR